MVVLAVKKGISSAAVTSIPDQWSKQWFRYFIDQFLTNADIRNVATGPGIQISGNVSGNSTSGTPSNSVTISQSPIANNTLLGNVSGATAIPIAVTGTQATAILDQFTSSLKGLVPGSGGGTTNFLRADGTWTLPPGSAPIPNNTVLGNVSGSSAIPVALTQVQLTTLINVFSATLSGAVTASGGGTTNFLRADGAWAAPTVPIGANPTASVGLSAVNGVATTFLRSDGAPALSQAITPTWSGLHTFSNGLTVSSGTFNTPGILDNSTVGHILTIANTGAVTHTAPSSGNIALIVNGATAAITTSLISALSTSAGADLRVARAGSTINTAEAGPNIFLEDTTNLVSHTLQTSGGQFELWRGTGAGPTLTQMFKITAAGGLVWNTPSSGQALVLTGIAGSFTSVFTGSATVGNSFGSRISAGTNTSDVSFEVLNSTAATAYLRVRGDGETFVAPNGVLLNTIAALTNNAGASAGTLGNAPAAGNPTKWIKINDNGTTRSIPAW